MPPAAKAPRRTASRSPAPASRPATRSRSADGDRKPAVRGALSRLQRYNQMRDFARTREPRGVAPPRIGHSFVIQQHDATRMHYDFRLEHRGVLLSWAVPKGPSLDPADKRLAVQTEDHPVSYRDFEGTIPEGEYGGGPVIVWDRGTWTPDDIDPDEGLRKGHLSFRLEGEKLHGRFQLVRLRGKIASGPKSNWLLIKRSDEHVRTGAQARITERMPLSVISQRRVSQIDADAPVAAAPRTVKRMKKSTTAKTAKTARKAKATSSAKATKSAKSAKPARKAGSAKATKTAAAPSTRTRTRATAKAASDGRAAPARGRKARMPALSSLDPQLATLVDRAPPGREWLYEVKFDGYRMLARLDGGRVALRSRNGLDWTATLPGIAAALETLAADQAIVDGELCYVDDAGRSDFQKLQNHMPRGRSGGTPSPRLMYFIFDLLFCDGRDLRAEPLLERKLLLRSLLGAKPARPLAYSDHLDGDGATAFLQACRAGLEGLIAKRRDAPYREGRGRDWLKLKCQKRQEFVIVGMIRTPGSRQGFRSLVLGLREDNGKLRFAGRVGTGFSQASLRDLAARLAKRVSDRSPLENPPRLAGVTWVRPDLVCEVEYTELTAEGSLRHPSFQGLREDKPATQVKQERPVPVVQALDSGQPARGAGRKPSRATDDGDSDTGDDRDDAVMGVRITHPARVMDDRSGVTKLELARYHEQVIALSMPYLANRPLALVRCPEGGAHQCFFQKHVMRGAGPHIIKGRAGGQEVLFIDEPVGVIELLQFNAIELHGWGATMAAPGQPDWFVIDLDPDTQLGFAKVVEAALEVREALASVGLASWVKTTGGKGLHVVVPLEREAGWEEVKGFTQAIARSLEQRAPDRYVATMSKARRVGKIFIDYLRNGQGATAIIPYSPRARPGATVAMPVDWKDLRGLDPKEFNVRSVPKWIAKRRRDPWRDFLDKPQRLPRLD